jgi:hypothetical protein
MPNEITVVEESVTKFLLKLMTERFMLERGVSTGVQASSTRGLSTSPSITQACPSRPVDEKRTKNRDDLMNVKLIPSILPMYLPPLRGAIHRDNVPRYFEYALVTTYLPKGIRAVRTDQDKIASLKFSDFNLGDRKVYSMLTPHNYLTRTKGKNLNIVP